MLKLFDPFAIERFTLPDDKDEPRSVFHLGILDATLYAALKEQASRVEVDGGLVDTINQRGNMTIVAKKKTYELQLVRFGVKGWENLDVPFDATKHLVSHPTPVGSRLGLTDEMLTRLKPAIHQLAARLEAINAVEETVEKNSDAPSK
jgi:hypothetical protein